MKLLEVEFGKYRDFDTYDCFATKDSAMLVTLCIHGLQEAFGDIWDVNFKKCKKLWFSLHDKYAPNRISVYLIKIDLYYTYLIIPGMEHEPFGRTRFQDAFNEIVGKNYKRLVYLELQYED